LATRIPFGADRFDLVFCRFLLEYLPDRADALAEMVRVCRPRGRVVLQDLDGQFVWHYPLDERLQAGIERVLDGLRATGFDPFVGRQLFSLARRVGLQDIEVRAESYHLIAGCIDDFSYELWTLKLKIALPAIAKTLKDWVAAEWLRETFLAYLRREDTLTYSVVFTVTGVKAELNGGSRENR